MTRQRSRSFPPTARRFLLVTRAVPRYGRTMGAGAGMPRRQALRAAGGAGLALAASAGGLPAWARAVEKVGALRGPDSLPFPRLAAGTESLPQIDHIVIVMMENHSFDNFLGL